MGEHHHHHHNTFATTIHSFSPDYDGFFLPLVGDGETAVSSQKTLHNRRLHARDLPVPYGMDLLARKLPFPTAFYVGPWQIPG